MKGHKTVGVGGWFAVLAGWLMLRAWLLRGVSQLSAVLRTD